MLFVWAVPAALWVLVHPTAGTCGRGLIPTRRPPRGAAEICPKGNMTANSTSLVQSGTSVTLLCQLPSPPQPCRVAIFLKSSKITGSSSRSVSTTVLLRENGKHTYTCKIICDRNRILVCGIDIECGNPPEEPRNLSCTQHGTDGHPTCTWDKGRPTHIPTTYRIQLSNETDVLCLSAGGQDERVGSVALSKLNIDSAYTLVVAAFNKLGSAFSRPLKFTLADIVEPHPPNFSVEFENCSVTSCTFSWPNEAPAQHCRLRYRPLAKDSWTTIEELSSERCQLHGLEPHTAYEFQVSCKIHPERGLWSNWSTYQAQTPEAAPTGLLDIWYRQQDLDSQQQNILLFWKALSESEARGRILQYVVTLDALDPLSSPSGEEHVTTQTSYSRVVPRVGYRITVTAENSRGRSPPASIETSLGTQDLPPPQEVSAKATGNGSISISWKPPVESTAAITGFVVEWAETPLEPHPAWVKLPASNLSTVIADHVEDDLCYHIGVSALYGNRAGQAARVRGHSGAKAPSAGPQMSTIPQANGVLVSWEDIPAPLQRGCIMGYHLYLQRKNRQEAPVVYDISNMSAQRWFYISNLQPGEHYILWMTASTAAGEGPWGNSELLTLESAGDWVSVGLTCSVFILSTCICSLPPVRKVLNGVLSALMPQWQSKAIPDPANAAWAKNYAAMKAELQSPSSLFLLSSSSFEEPETTQVEETFLKSNLPALQEKLLSGSSGKRENGDHWSSDSSSGQEEPQHRALPGTADREGDEQNLPDLYKEIVVLEVTEHTQTISEYLASPIANITTTNVPLVKSPAEEQPDLECDGFSIFPTTFLTPLVPYGGNLTLDAIRINSSTR